MGSIAFVVVLEVAISIDAVDMAFELPAAAGNAVDFGPEAIAHELDLIHAVGHEANALLDQL